MLFKPDSRQTGQRARCLPVVITTPESTFLRAWGEEKLSVRSLNLPRTRRETASANTWVKSRDQVQGQGIPEVEPLSVSAHCCLLQRRIFESHFSSRKPTQAHPENKGVCSRSGSRGREKSHQCKSFTQHGSCARLLIAWQHGCTSAIVARLLLLLFYS